MKKVLENIFSLYTKLCDPTNFTQETSQRTLNLERNLKVSGMQLPQNPAQSEKHFNKVLYTQKEIVVLTIEEAKTRAKLVQIQATLTSHLEILQKELAYVEIVLKKHPNLSTLDVLVHLVVETTIQIKSLEVSIQN